MHPVHVPQTPDPKPPLARCPEPKAGKTQPEATQTVKLTNPIIGRSRSLEVPICKAPVRRRTNKTRTARISLQCVYDVKEHTTPDDNSAAAPKSLSAFCGTAIDVIWSSTSASLLRRRCPTVEARFTERLRGGQELFYPSSAFRIVSLGCA